MMWMLDRSARCWIFFAGRMGWKRSWTVCLDTVFQLAGIADRFQMTEVEEALEDTIITQLTTGSCADMLMRSGGLGLRRVEAAARRVVVERFEEEEGTEGFMGMDEEALRDVLEDDGLVVRKEELVLEKVVAWMKG